MLLMVAFIQNDKHAAISAKHPILLQAGRSSVAATHSRKLTGACLLSTSNYGESLSSYVDSIRIIRIALLLLWFPGLQPLKKLALSECRDSWQLDLHHSVFSSSSLIWPNCVSQIVKHEKPILIMWIDRNNEEEEKKTLWSLSPHSIAF